MLLSIIAFVLVLSVLVAVHELGHMLAAKACGVAVPEFAIGFGPTIFSFKRGETKYCLNIIPLGGYCAIAGLAEDVVDAPGADTSEWVFPEERTWQAKNGWQKALMLAGGPLMNFLLALIVMIAMGFIGFTQGIIMFNQIMPASPADEAGLENGDILLALDGKEIETYYQFKSLIQQNEGRSIPIVVRRGDGEVTAMVTPRVLGDYNESNASIGVGLDIGILSNTKVAMVQPKTVAYGLKLKPGDVITHIDGREIHHGWELMARLAGRNKDGELVDRTGKLLPADVAPLSLSVLRGGEQLAVELPGDTTFMSLGLMFHPELEQLPVLASIQRSLEEAFYMALSTVALLKAIFSPEGARSLAGPVGVFNMVGQSVHSGIYTFLQMVMMISFSLGLFNLLPLPALDGGRLVFVALKGIGIHVPPKREMAIHLVGFMMIIGLVLLMTFFDVMALVRYNQP